MRITWLVPRRVPDVPSPLVEEVSSRLRRRGHVVTSLRCDREAFDLERVERQHDLLVLKSHTELALSYAQAVERDGGRVLNAAHACAAVQDKLLATRMLGTAGVPVPRTHVTASWERVADLVARGRTLVKPLRGHRGAGVEVLTEVARVRGRPDMDTPVLVQELVPGPGEDLKVYVVGTQVWAVRKPFSATSFAVPGRPVAVTARVREIALEVGRTTGLALFGLDVIESPDGPVVVDVNYLPGYKGCEGVAGPMTDLVEAAAASSTRGEVA